MPKYTTNKCQGYETFQRMNYLFQIRDFVASNVGNSMVSTYYGNLIISIAKKSVLRIDPTLKRQICKKCRGPLLLGKTMKVKIKSNKKVPIVKWTCSQCNHVKLFPVSPQAKIWSERPESIIEILDYNKKKSQNSEKPSKE